MGDFSVLISVFVLGCGLYCLYAAYMMKKDGTINQTILLGKDMNVNKCKDKEAYIKSVTPKVIGLGIAATLSGASDLINLYIIPIEAATYVFLVLFVVVLFWYAVGTSKAAKKYFK